MSRKQRRQVTRSPSKPMPSGSRWRPSFRWVALGILAVVGVAGAAGLSLTGSAETTIAALAPETHFHGIAPDPVEPGKLLLATHHGLFQVDDDGTARRVSGVQHDLMGFASHPYEPTKLFASGHPAAGGNLGLIASADAGRSWTSHSPGALGPADFHQLAVSPADPRVMYGVHRGLQASEDGGRTWRVVGPAPVGLAGLAGSTIDPVRLYAATQNGLLMSMDGGRSWHDVPGAGAAASMVHVTPDGEIHAFLTGRGLVRASERGMAWRTVSSQFADGHIRHFAIDPGGGRRQYAVIVGATGAQRLSISRDGGATWRPLGGK